MRWKEEVLLLGEEMRRTLAFLEFFSNMWSTRASPSSLVVPSKDPAIREGISAYAHYQSHVFASIQHRYHSIWNGVEKAGDPATEPTSIVLEKALVQLLGDDI